MEITRLSRSSAYALMDQLGCVYPVGSAKRLPKAFAPTDTLAIPRSSRAARGVYRVCTAAEAPDDATRESLALRLVELVGERGERGEVFTVDNAAEAAPNKE